jgi:hypothetical protein
MTRLRLVPSQDWTALDRRVAYLARVDAVEREVAARVKRWRRRRLWHWLRRVVGR